MSLLTLLNPSSTLKLFSLLSPTHTHKQFSSQTLKLPTKRIYSLSPLEESDYHLIQNGDVELEDRVIGDCLVFEEGVFEDPYLQNDVVAVTKKSSNPRKTTKRKTKNNVAEVEPVNLVPEKWREVQEEINMTKKEKRKIAQQIQFGSRVEKKKEGYLPLKSLNLKEYLAYKEEKMAQLKPLVLDNPTSFRDSAKENEIEQKVHTSSSERVEPKNPKWAVYGRGLDDVSEFFNSENYEPPDKKSEGKAFFFFLLFCE